VTATMVAKAAGLPPTRPGRSVQSGSAEKGTKIAGAKLRKRENLLLAQGGSRRGIRRMRRL
jgi:hypothetical protein